MQYNPYKSQKESVFSDNWQVLYNGAVVAICAPYHKKWSVTLERDKPAFWIKDTLSEALLHAAAMHGSDSKKNKTNARKGAADLFE